MAKLSKRERAKRDRQEFNATSMGAFKNPVPSSLVGRRPAAAEKAEKARIKIAKAANKEWQAYKASGKTYKEFKSAAKATPKDNKGPWGASKAGTAKLKAARERGAAMNKAIAGLKDFSKQYGGEGAARGAKGFKYAGGTNATGGGP